VLDFIDEDGRYIS